MAGGEVIPYWQKLLHSIYVVEIVSDVEIGIWGREEERR